MPPSPYAYSQILKYGGGGGDGKWKNFKEGVLTIQPTKWYILEMRQDWFRFPAYFKTSKDSSLIR